MKIVVTGGLGFIGSNFIRHILGRYGTYRVVNVDKKTYAGNFANLTDINHNPRYEWVRADISDRKKVFECLKGADAVVHFAAETHVDRSILSPGDFIKTNVLGTQVLLDAARLHKISKFVHVSTDEVYGSKEKGYSSEDDVLMPNSPYSASKAASDLLVRAYCVTYGVPAVITRCTNNFGPYQYPEKMLPLLITNAFEDKPFPLYGDGLQMRDWIYVLDHVKAIDAVLHRGFTGEVYNIGSMNTMTNRDLAWMVLKIMGKPTSLVQKVQDRPGHDRRYALNCDKTKKELGWSTETPFEDALDATIQWYRENPRWWKKIKARNKYRTYYRKQYVKR